MDLLIGYKFTECAWITASVIKISVTAPIFSFFLGFLQCYKKECPKWLQGGQPASFRAHAHTYRILHTYTSLLSKKVEGYWLTFLHLKVPKRLAAPKRLSACWKSCTHKKAPEIFSSIFSPLEQPWRQSPSRDGSCINPRLYPPEAHRLGILLYKQVVH